MRQQQKCAKDTQNVVLCVFARYVKIVVRTRKSLIFEFSDDFGETATAPVLQVRK